MKHVRSLQGEPGLLGDYRRLPQSGANQDARYAKEVWKQFKKRAPEAYRELRDSLASQQQGLCMYCERLLVERRPRARPPALVRRMRYGAEGMTNRHALAALAALERLPSVRTDRKSTRLNSSHRT